MLEKIDEHIVANMKERGLEPVSGPWELTPGGYARLFTGGHRKDEQRATVAVCFFGIELQESADDLRLSDLCKSRAECAANTYEKFTEGY